MRKTIFILIVITCCFLFSCKKKSNDPPSELTSTPIQENSYSSLTDFYTKNGVTMETFTLNSATGGSFVSQKSTTIIIPPNAFQTNGIATIEFKDIYSKSDMLLSNKPTNSYNNAPLISGGEFYIKASINNLATQLTGSVGIDVLQPLNSPQDTSMKAFNALADSAGNFVWNLNPINTVLSTATHYIFSLYQFSNPLSSGSWCNSDSPSFYNVPQTTLTAQTSQIGYSPDIFLVFTDVKSMIHVYSNSENTFPYIYAPIGYKCTVVAIGLKDGKLYSSFTPITISNNQTINFTLSETTTENFKTTLSALN